MELHMDSNLVECDLAGRDVCVCKGGPTLAILKDVQKAYEERMALIERMGGDQKLQMQVDVLRSWVSDLVGQNTLLARAVEELESEATSRLLLERNRHTEREKKRKMNGNPTELKILNDSLQKENIAKDREIRRLNKDVQQYEQTIINLRHEMSLGKHYSSSVPKKDAEVMAGMCCTGNECGDWEPVRECSLALREETSKYQERIHKMETTLKASSDDVRTLRKVNVALSEELHGTRRVCALLSEQCRAATLRTQFKEDIIREMRRQLNQAKNKLKELTETKSVKKELSDREYPHSSVSTYDSVTIACVRQQPRKRIARAQDSQRPYSSDERSHRLDGSGDDVLSVRMD